MANILLTQRCVRSCPYCFAQKYMDGQAGKDTLSWEDLIYIADLFQNSNEWHMSLLGGEPTLHEQFVEMVLYLVSRNFHVSVFTSGVMSKKKLEQAKSSFTNCIKEQRLSFICNVNNPKDTEDSELKTVRAFLDAFSDATALSFNIYKDEFDMQFLIDHINRHKLRRYIRLGLAHPIPGADNMYIRKENFRSMADRLASYISLLQEEKISAGFDCGFPSCIFTNEQLGGFFRLSNSESNAIKFACSSAIDIGPDMSIWNCFPLSNVSRRSLFEFDSLKEVREYYGGFAKDVRKISPGIFPECKDCPHVDTVQCRGGCLAHIINDNPEEFEALLKKRVSV